MLRREPWASSDPSILEWVTRFDPEIEKLLRTPIQSLPGEAALVEEVHRLQAQHELFAAAEQGDIERVGMFLDKGLGANTRDAQGRTPLVYAVNARQGAMVTYLLGRGADPNSQTNDGLSVLANALIYGDARLCAHLLAAGAKVNVQSKHGDTPLIEAARYDDLPRVIEFLHYGADPNLRPKEGPGALDWAALHGNKQLIAVLKKAGAKEFKRPQFSM